MRTILITLTALLALGPANAQYTQSSTQPQSPRSTSSAQLIEQGYYTNVSGHSVHRPAHTRSTTPCQQAHLRNAATAATASVRITKVRVRIMAGSQDGCNGLGG